MGLQRVRHTGMWSQVALRKHHYKASRGDGIPLELFQTLKDDAVKVLHSICQQIWNNSAVATGLEKVSFHSNPKEVKWSEVTQLCLTLCSPMDYSLPRSSVHWIFQARILEWVAISFSKSQKKAVPKNAQTTAQLHSSHMLVKYCSKFSKPGFSNTWTMNFQMFKLDLEKAEELEIKLPISNGSLKKQENSR